MVGFIDKFDKFTRFNLQNQKGQPDADTGSSDQLNYFQSKKKIPVQNETKK